MEVYISGSVRTPIGNFLGSLSSVPTVKLGVECAKETLRRSEASPDSVDEVIIGHVLAATQGQNPARQVSVGAGLSESVPAGQVSILCGSGMKSILDGARAIRAGDASVVLCGGMESMSRAAHASHLRNLKKMGPLKMTQDNYEGVKLNDTMMTDGLMCSLTNQHMGNTAENIAKKYEISKAEQDDFAFNSIQKAIEAKESGRLKDEIIPITNENGTTVSEDEGPKKITRADMDNAKPCFEKDGTVTPMNCCGLNDGAATLLLSSSEKAQELGLKSEAKIIGTALVGLDPNVMGLGPVFAIRKLLETQCPWALDEVDLFELNEAFAAQSLGVLKELKISPSKVNVNGGSIALGHPIGASGCRIVATLISALRQRKLKKGIAALCIGGGQGVALAIELL